MSDERNKSPILNTSMVSKTTLDPFLYCVFHVDKYPAARDDTMEAPREGDGQDFNPIAPYRMYHGTKVPGFPKHPHRGFETITATVDGIIDHSDSLGNAGRYGNGDLQWMTAGKGVVHSEMFPLIHKEQPNTCRFFQIWINLPTNSKLAEPSFAMFWQHTIPKWTSSAENDDDDDDGLAKATIFYGDYLLPDGQERNPNRPPPHSWAANPANDVAVIHMTIQRGGSLSLPRAHGGGSINRVLYVVEGSTTGFTINKIKAKGQMMTVDASMDLVLELSSSSTTTNNNNINNNNGPIDILLLQGKPISEPVAQSGPFVMNTHEEVAQAEADYRETQFGGWPWPRPDMIFPRERGRFSLLHGTETVPDE